MVKLNLDHVFLEENKITPLLQTYIKKVGQLAIKMEKGTAIGSNFLGWKDLPVKYDAKEIVDIEKTAKKLFKLNVKLLVVVGIGGSFIGSKAAIEMIKGLYPINSKGVEVIFIGENVSSTNLVQKLSYLSNKDFAINVISKSGKTLESAIAFRLLKEILEKKLGEYNASKHIIVTTDANNGALLALAKYKNYKTFVIPDNIGGRFSVLTPVGLFPMACAGLNINDVLIGAKKGYDKYHLINLNENDAYKYAVTRHILSKKYSVELMVQFEPQMQAFSEWWKQLAGESEGKNSQGVFPASAIFSTDLHSLGQFIQEGSKVLFETILFFEKPLHNMQINVDKDNFDKLNNLSNLSVHQINHQIFNATVDAHSVVAKVPIIEIICQNFSEKTFGQLVIFFQRAIAMTAYLSNVNPFDQTGVEVYKQNMKKNLESLIQ